MGTPNLATSLLDKYGALMTVSDLSELLGTTPKRISNGFANNLPWCRPFQRARIKIGRRVHLNTATVAEILEEIQRAGTDFSAQHLCIRCGVRRDPLAGGMSVTSRWLPQIGGHLAATIWPPLRAHRSRSRVRHRIDPIALPNLA